jgi:hypothetical protein
MSRAKQALWRFAGPLLVTVAACSASEATSGFSDGESSPDGGKGGGSFSDGGGSAAPPPGPSATGVILVHAAGFPSLRLCFESAPELRPQPDSRVMPEANVVGVEVGSLVRIAPLTKAPGKIYVINERYVRSTPGGDSLTCGELVGPSGTLLPLLEYYVAPSLTRTLGTDGVSVLAISGCGSQALLDVLGLAKESCGPGWDVTRGNLQAKVVDLATTADGATDTTLPVQLFQLSQAIEAFRASSPLEIAFGDLVDGGAPGQTVIPGDLFEGGKQTALAIDQSQPTTYGKWGFRISATTPSSSFEVKQSLAAIQELSSPREVPTTYYGAASNYALLLLGDPTHTAKLGDGGANPLFNPRQAVHLLAVPVIDPEADAGADAATNEPDGGQ